MENLASQQHKMYRNTIFLNYKNILDVNIFVSLHPVYTHTDIIHQAAHAEPICYDDKNAH